MSFATFGYKVRAVREEWIQKHVYLPLLLVQDSGLIPSRITGFIPSPSFGNRAATVHSQFVAE